MSIRCRIIMFQIVSIRFFAARPLVDTFKLHSLAQCLTMEISMHDIHGMQFAVDDSGIITTRVLNPFLWLSDLQWKSSCFFSLDPL